MSEIPDGLPSLARGAHLPGDGEACAMEYISVITGNEFSDLPPCTSEVIAHAVQVLNDAMSTEDRARLIPLLARIARSGYDSDELLDALARLVGCDPELMHVHRNKVTAVWEKMARTLENTPGGGPYYENPPTPEQIDAGLALLNRILDTHDEYAKAAGWLVEDEIPVTSPEALAKARALIQGGLIDV